MRCAERAVPSGRGAPGADAILSLRNQAQKGPVRVSDLLRLPSPIRLVPLLVLALVVTAPAAAALIAVPAASASPSAAQIDEFLAAHSSPMTGDGAAFVAAGRKNGVDPAFLVAIAGAESSFGRFLYSEGGDQCTYNAFNWFYGATWPQSDFASWSEAIARVAQGLAGGLYYGSGLYSVQAIAPRYCPDGTANWVANVTSFMIQLGGNPPDTRLTATYGPASSDPALLGVDGEVELSGEPFEVGREVTARFTLTNIGDQPVALDGIQLMAVDPRGSSVWSRVGQAGDAPPRSAARGRGRVAAALGRALERLDRGRPGRAGEPDRREDGVHLPCDAAAGCARAPPGARRRGALPGASPRADPRLRGSRRPLACCLRTGSRGRGSAC